MNNIKEFIYKLGVFLRNPSLKSEYNFLLKSDKWTYQELIDYQLEKCKELLEFAYKYSPYYKDLFDNTGFDPFSFNKLEDLKKLPVLDKKTLLDENSKIQSSYKFKKIVKSETSGTSGEALLFYRNEEWDSKNRAAMFRGYHWYGVNPWDKNGYFWGYNINKKDVLKTQILDKLQNRFRLFNYDEKSIRDFTKKLQTSEFVSGYSSMIYEVAKIINKLNLQNKYSLKMVKGTSEKIYDRYQSEVKKAFGKKLISEYGACETGIIAYECPEGGNMHICMEHVIVEEEKGEILVTNLLSKSFPIIRYKLGDSVKLAPRNFKCKCGRQHPVILDVLGRIGKNVIGYKKKYPSLTFYYVFKNLTLKNNIALNYQAIQNEEGKVFLKIEQNTPDVLPFLEKEIKKYFSNDVDFKISFGEVLHTMDGKLKDFITTLE